MRVAVVGSGVLGASAAFHLVVAGAEVAVFDAGHPGKATLAGAGIVCPWRTTAADPEYVRLYCAGAAAFPALLAELQRRGFDDTGYANVGGLIVGDDAYLDGEQQRIARRAANWPEAGDIHRVDADAVASLFPPLRRTNGVLLSGGGRVDGAALAACLLAAAGVTPVSGEVSLVLVDGRIAGVFAGGAPYEFDAVVVAGGAWTDALLAPAGVVTGVVPQKGQIVHLAVPAADTAAWPTVHPPGPHYLLAFPAGRVVAGATRETGSGYDTRVTAAGQHEVLEAALQAAPGLADAVVLETRVGLRPFPADGRPTLGAVPGVAGLYVGTGMGAGGLTMGPLGGRLLAQLSLGEPTGFDVTPFSPAR